MAVLADDHFAVDQRQQGRRVLEISSREVVTGLSEMRLRPARSAIAPAAMSVLPKASMKALVIHLSSIGLPASAAPMAGVATAGPVKLSGIENAASSTAHRTGVVWVTGVALRYRLVAPHLPEFHEKYPAISLDIDFSDELVDVIEERFDAVVRSGNLANSGLTGRKLGPFSFVVCAAPRYFARHGVPQTPADLTSHACLHFRYRTSGKLQRWGLGPDSERLELPQAFVTNNAEAVRAAALEGLGIAYTPSFVVLDALRDGRLQPALESYPKDQGTFWILWPSKRQVPARLRALIEHLTTRFDATG
jgi:DNA-binding transcriptional LysR family regulator